MRYKFLAGFCLGLTISFCGPNVIAQTVPFTHYAVKENKPPSQIELEVIKTYLGHELKGEAIIQIHYSGDGNYLLSTATDGLAKLWTMDGQLVKKFAGSPVAMIFNGAFSPDGAAIITAGYNGVARIWDLQGNILGEIRGHTSAVTDVVFFSEDMGVATSSDDGTIKGWSNIKEPLFTVTRPGVSRNMDFNAQANLIAVTQDIGEITLLNLAGEVVKIIETNQGRLNSVRFSKDGKLLVSGGFDGTARVFNLQGQELLKIDVLDDGWVTGVAINENNLIATVSDDGVLRLWNLQGSLLDSYNPNLERLGSVSFHPNGKNLAIAAYHGTIILLELK
ncbi:WD40 repeat domain-containing protein [Synechocystis sp. PCC 7339]|uniref:WD40 repeat domain-containing protein n=1 Tax=unclassified Synechocystis TaxID=2640012 RepID=UPI001BAE92A7|nr:MULTISPECIES: WD40 repeat domain-containing protein [unclassified Synechocystis]QUS61809.1 WD40 repeat domain-containing protein [Synechocystis sp. PCC 7338]UAJ74004.1 WD40 repeat domain-containing protein [Synechocystis sp. PCC 7339]